jgi:hypothetical protein
MLRRARRTKPTQTYLNILNLNDFNTMQKKQEMQQKTLWNTALGQHARHLPTKLSTGFVGK